MVLSLLLVIIGLLFLKLARDAWRQMKESDLSVEEIQAAGVASLGALALVCFGAAIAVLII